MLSELRDEEVILWISESLVISGYVVMSTGKVQNLHRDLPARGIQLFYRLSNSFTLETRTHYKDRDSNSLHKK